jgi:hypothetical protein
MTRRIAIAVAAALLAFPAASEAKGPAEATLTGPGLDEPIRFEWNGRVADLGLLLEQSGFSAAAFGRAPNPMLARRPEGPLGPRYTITYELGEPVRQHVYPWAQGGPLTHMPGGQPFWDTKTTDRGWYRASALTDTLVSAGLPTSPITVPSRPARSRQTPKALTGLAAIGLGLLASASSLFAWRRLRSARATAGAIPRNETAPTS